MSTLAKRFLNQVTGRLTVLALTTALSLACGGGGDSAPSATAPVITTEPASISVFAGATATFSVAATSSTPLSYQWRKGGLAINGATSAAYTTPVTTTADNATTFSVVVRNSASSVISMDATLTITPAGTALDLPRNAEGWTVFTPSSDTRIMYVSSSGNDVTAVEYTAISNANPFDPQGTVLPFKTYKAAKAHTRSGCPDWVLFKRGETFTEDLCDATENEGSIRSGRSASEPALVGAYGATGLSPVFKIIKTGIMVQYLRSSTTYVGQYIAIIGLKFYSYTRNPDDPEYNSLEEGGTGISIWCHENNRIHNILVEGCSTSYCSTGITVYSSAVDLSYVENVDVRRNVIMNTYSNSGAHSQGMWSAHVKNFLVEENVFDHNGWLIQANGAGNLQGQATMFNHNTYNSVLTNAIFRNNIFTRASSMGTKFTAPYDIENLEIKGNLYIDGEIGINICTNYPDRPYRVKGAIIRENVFYNIGRSNPTNRGVSWGIEIAGWDGGAIHDNLMVHNIIQKQIALLIEQESRNTNIFKNIIYNNGGAWDLVNVVNLPACQNMSLNNNYFELHGINQNMLSSTTSGAISGVAFSGNNYYSQAPSLFNIVSNPLNPAQWVATYEPNATFTKRTFPDDTRTIETYMTSIGQTSTLDAFIEKCRAQDRYNWDSRLSANAVNTWIRTGFGF